MQCEGIGVFFRPKEMNLGDQETTEHAIHKPLVSLVRKTFFD